MNCKKGDAAYITGLPLHLSEANGHFVRCAEPCQINGRPGWVFGKPARFTVSRDFRSALSGQAFRAGEVVIMASLYDENLRPLPGLDDDDDVSDQAPADKRTLEEA